MRLAGEVAAGKLRTECCLCVSGYRATRSESVANMRCTKYTGSISIHGEVSQSSVWFIVQCPKCESSLPSGKVLVPRQKIAVEAYRRDTGSTCERSVLYK